MAQGKQALAVIGMVTVFRPTFATKLADALTEFPQGRFGAYVNVGVNAGP